MRQCDGIKFPGSSAPLVASHLTGKKDATTGSSAASFIASSGGKTPTLENGVAYIALSHGVSAPDVA